MAIVPIWSRQDPETGELQFALSHDDFEKVRQGYGCSHCLQDYGGVFQTKCPLCKADTFVEAPQWWTGAGG